MARPKLRKPANTRYTAPKDAEVYRVKRLYWALLLFEDKMMRDITKVSMKDYQNLLMEYTTLAGTLKPKGKIKYKYGEHNPDTRMGYKEAETSSTSESGQAEVSGNRPSDMGVGVQTVNPIT